MASMRATVLGQRILERMRLSVVTNATLICGHAAMVAAPATRTAAATGGASLNRNAEQPLDDFHISLISCRTEQWL